MKIKDIPWGYYPNGMKANESLGRAVCAKHLSPFTEWTTEKRKRVGCKKCWDEVHKETGLSKN